MIRWAVFASGTGSNLQNFIDLEPRLSNSKLGLVVSDRSCPALEKAKSASKEIFQYSPKSSDFDHQLLEVLKKHSIDSIFLMGYMRILSANFLQSWAPKRIVNLHPSLLPKYKGKDAVKQALEAGEKILGVSLHEVVAEMDAGKVLRQEQLQCLAGESLEDLMKRIHFLEHKMVEDYLFDLDRQ
jgi:phosphoribosylglycinamide formyltransferase-1